MKIYRAQWLIVNADTVLQNAAFVEESGAVRKILEQKEFLQFVREHPAVEVEEHYLIFPGFINAHVHQYGLLAHGIPVNVTIRDFEDFLRKFWWPFVENRIACRDVLVTARASAAEMIASGVTGFCDILEAPCAEPGTLVEQARLIEKIGMRAVLSLESCERIDKKNGKFCLEENARLIRWCRENSRLISGMVCTHTAFTCSVPFLKKAAALAESLDALWHFHLSESRYESDWTQKKFGVRAVNHYEQNKLLSGRVLASQCVKVNEEELGILRERGVRPVHMPMSNCEVGGGFSPVPRMLDMGISVAVGTDGYDNNYLRNLQMAFLLHKAVQEDPSVLNAREVFRMGTENGARALGWKNCGTLDEGRQADFVCMESLFPTPLREENIFDQIVVYSRKEYISDVYCAGRALLKDGRHSTLDAQKAQRDMVQCAAGFWNSI